MGVPCQDRSEIAGMYHTVTHGTERLAAFHKFRNSGFCTNTGFGANSNQGQKVASIGYYLGLLVTISNDTDNCTHT